MGPVRSPIRTALAAALLFAGVGIAVPQAADAAAAAPSIRNVVPAPVSVRPSTGTPYALNATTRIYTAPGATAVGEYLARIWRRSTGYPLMVVAAPGGAQRFGISLLLAGADPSVGAEGYQLDSSASGVVVRATQPAGLFAGVQT